MKYLSVAVPCYNVEEFLDQCLSSFADDRLRGPLEVLIVDDGSTDSTPEIARRYVERYPDIFRLIQKENGGHGSAVNAGIQNATGKYFRIVDGDDWVDTDNLVRFIDCSGNRHRFVVDQSQGGYKHRAPTFVKLPSKIIFNHRRFSQCQRRRGLPFHALHWSARLDILKENNIRLLERAFYVDNEYLLKVASPAAT